jgi:hypothetical protein
MEYDLGIPLRFARVSNFASYTISNHGYIDQKESLLNPHLADAIFLYKVQEQ